LQEIRSCRCHFLRNRLLQSPRFASCLNARAILHGRLFTKNESCGYGIERPFFWLDVPDSGRQPQRNKVHIAFSAGSKKEVADFHAAALEAGGIDNGAPGYRPQYDEGHYAAFVLDPDGNNIEAVYRETKPEQQE
jgi:catechol 2,3-dioxygenase-like lactoylglutathione lyase family enzyme